MPMLPLMPLFNRQYDHGRANCVCQTFRPGLKWSGIAVVIFELYKTNLHSVKVDKISFFLV